MTDHTHDVPPHQHGGTDAPECTTCGPAEGPDREARLTDAMVEAIGDYFHEHVRDLAGDTHRAMLVGAELALALLPTPPAPGDEPYALCICDGHPAGRHPLCQRHPTPPAPGGRCNCHAYGDASRCPVHTQADYDAAELTREPASGVGDTDLRAEVEAAVHEVVNSHRLVAPAHPDGPYLCICGDRSVRGGTDFRLHFLAVLMDALGPALAARDTDQEGPEWTQAEWQGWSDHLAELMPERYDGDEAQEALIERFVREAAARDTDQGAGERQGWDVAAIERGRAAEAEAALAAVEALCEEWESLGIGTPAAFAYQVRAALARATPEAEGKP
jgi:hypothetical protein